MLRLLPALLAVGLIVYCLVECLQAPGRDVRTFRKGIWVALILLLPVAGALGWLFAGRPHRARHGNPPRQASQPLPPPPPTYPLGPDDDPDFLERLRREQEQRRSERRGDHED